MLTCQNWPFDEDMPGVWLVRWRHCFYGGTFHKILMMSAQTASDFQEAL
jgi:hypothetical protein